MNHCFSSPPLENFLLKNTSDIEEIHALVSSILTPHRVKKISDPTENNRKARLHHAPLVNSSFNYLVYATKTKIDVAQLGFFLIEIPLSGKSITRCGGHTIVSGVGQAVIAGPYHQFSTEWTIDCSKLLIKIESNALENYLSTLLGRKQIRALDFDMKIELESDSGKSLLRTITWIIDELEHCGSLLNTNRLAGLHHEYSLMWSLLHAQQNNYSEELQNLKLPAVPEFLSDTKKYIEVHYAESIKLKELVSISGVSERLLLGGFREYFDISPMKYLRLVRLENVHLMLKELSPDTGNVTEVALSNGFTQLGKFSADYKERFGESPSETLKIISPLPTT